MNMNEKICRLCLQTISRSYQTIDQSLKNILKVNMDICREAVACTECTNNLELFFELKSACDYMRQPQMEFKVDINLDPEKIEITDNLTPLTELKNEVKCCFCTKTSEKEGLTSLNESRDHKFLVNVLTEHIPKLNLSVTEELLTCKICLDKLHDVVGFVMKCLDVEQKISKYAEIKRDDEGQIELKDVQEFIFYPIVKFETKFIDVNGIAERYDQFQERYTMQADTEIKQEIDYSEFFIKTEHVDIKTEDNDCDSFQEPPAPFKIDNENLDISSSTIIETDDVPSDISALKSRGRSKNYVNQHELMYINTDGITMYKCGTCPYETKSRFYLGRHELTHKSISELTTFKCDLCPYEAIHLYYLKRHKRRHKSSSERTMLKCELCPYETKWQKYFTQHKRLIHESSSNITFKCDLCSHETNRKFSLKRHQKTHKSVSDIKLFKCGKCTFVTKCEDYLKEHILLHKMFKCELCPYETKYQDCLIRHKLIHEGTLNITMFKCDLCSYVAICKDFLKQHKLIHKNKVYYSSLGIVFTNS